MVRSGVTQAVIGPQSGGYEQPVGQVIAVRGSVVDCRFIDTLPHLRTRLDAGEDGAVVIHVAQTTQSFTSLLERVLDGVRNL